MSSTKFQILFFTGNQLNFENQTLSYMLDNKLEMDSVLIVNQPELTQSSKGFLKTIDNIMSMENEFHGPNKRFEYVFILTNSLKFFAMTQRAFPRTTLPILFVD